MSINQLRNQFNMPVRLERVKSVELKQNDAGVDVALVEFPESWNITSELVTPTPGASGWTFPTVELQWDESKGGRKLKPIEVPLLKKTREIRVPFTELQPWQKIAELIDGQEGLDLGQMLLAYAATQPHRAERRFSELFNAEIAIDNRNRRKWNHIIVFDPSESNPDYDAAFMRAATLYGMSISYNRAVTGRKLIALERWPLMYGQWKLNEATIVEQDNGDRIVRAQFDIAIVMAKAKAAILSWDSEANK